jgi:membrane protein required for colicin V production
MVGATGLSLVDRLLGSLFGLGRGIVIVLAAFIVCGMTSLPEQPAWKYAKVRPAVEATAKAVKPMLPEALARHVRV